MLEMQTLKLIKWENFYNRRWQIRIKSWSYVGDIKGPLRSEKVRKKVAGAMLTDSCGYGTYFILGWGWHLVATHKRPLWIHRKICWRYGHCFQKASDNHNWSNRQTWAETERFRSNKVPPRMWLFQGQFGGTLYVSKKIDWGGYRKLSRLFGAKPKVKFSSPLEPGDHPELARIGCQWDKTIPITDWYPPMACVIKKELT